ncbi:MAG: hypothetical protein ACYSTO_11820 [Planctomycetota bacterium]
MRRVDHTPRPDNGIKTHDLCTVHVQRVEVKVLLQQRITTGSTLRVPTKVSRRSPADVPIVSYCRQWQQCRQ